MTARSVIRSRVLSQARNLRDVPFVELYAGRLIGVTASDSDPNRVYISFFEGGSGDYYCCTNNNRPCGSLRGGPCKHHGRLMQDAVLQFGAARIITYLGLALDPDKAKTHHDLLRGIRGSTKKAEAGMGFSRFLSYLAQVNLPPTTMPVPEMNWFVR